MHIPEFRACVVILFLALACIVVAVPGYARTDFDGDWNILIVTREGACDPTLRYAVKVADGTVINDGASIATVQGRISPRGAMRVIVRSGSQWANGSGHFSGKRGDGVWRGQGTNGTCAGIWVAGRRE
jgi:hypothetical protein